MFKKLQRCLALSVVSASALVGSLGFVGSANAGYSNVVFFGDSISDTGNVLSLTTAFGAPSFPNYSGAPGRFSNGPVWTEYLAAGLGFADSAKPSNLLFAGPMAGIIPIGVPGGQNYSYGGARTGLGGSAGATTGLVGQLIAWDGSLSLLGTGALGRAADPDALYVVVAGANDLRDARSGDAAARSTAAAETAQNLTNALGLLAQAGARHFLISNLPDLGKTPEAVDLGNVAESTDITNQFNAQLIARSNGLDAFFLGSFGVDLDIRMMNFHGLVERISEDALTNGGATYGITNVTSPCLAPGAFSGEYFFPDAIDINCSISSFSDDLHPSGASHRLLGLLALNTVPEPGSLALVGLGLLVITARRRRI